MSKKQFDWMITPTTASAWAQGGGLMVWLSVACGLVGAGGYIAGAICGSFMAMAISWLIVTVLKNFVHLLHMSKKSKVMTMANNFGSAWIARGTVFTALFSALGFIQLLVMYLAPSMVGINILLMVLAGLMAVGIIAYEVCLLASNRAIPFWQGAMVPVTFTLFAAACGITLVLGFVPELGATAPLIAIVLFVVLLLSVAFSIWAAGKANETSAASAKELTSGSQAGMFWGTGIVIGIIIPAAICIAAACGVGTSALFIGAWACTVIGTLGYTLCVFKAAKYRSLI